jgi:hypothetical protein
MKRLLFFIAILLQNNLHCAAQDSIYILHPILGEFIDSTEKKDYYLFPEIVDTSFNYGFINKIEDVYFLNVVLFHKDSLYVKKIDTSELFQYKINIEKIHNYYLKLSSKDSISNYDGKGLRRDIINNRQNINNDILINNANTNKIKGDINKIQQVNYDMESAKLRKQGIGNFTRFYNPSSNKKK